MTDLEKEPPKERVYTDTPGFKAKKKERDKLEPEEVLPVKDGTRDGDYELVPKIDRFCGTHKTRARKVEVLSRLASMEWPQPVLACRQSSLHPMRHGEYMRDDPVYRESFEALEMRALERLDFTAYKRATGYQRELTYKGQKTGDTVTEHSDRLLELVLRAKVEGYAEQGKGEAAVTINIAQFSPDSE